MTTKAEDSTTAEPTETAPQSAPKQWRMPRPCKGQPVLFFYRGTVSEQNADVGFVTGVGERVIELNHRGNGYRSVYHEDDPRLVENPALRSDIDGVWRFTDVDREVQERFTKLENEIAELKNLLK